MSQEIEALVDVGNDRLFLGEREPSFLQKLLYQGFDFLFKQFFGDASHDKIVGKPDVVDLGVVAGLRFRVAL